MIISRIGREAVFVAACQQGTSRHHTEEEDCGEALWAFGTGVGCKKREHF
jgi:hypothetical protein